jgi:methionyl-tRNA formyltransferase
VPLRIVFFGSPQFAVPTLQALAADDEFSVDLVVTQPDRPAGRGRGIVEPPAKIAASALGISVWQPTTLKSADALERLSAMGADLFIVVAYGELFQRAVLALPSHGCLNVHPSLLPRYRGSSPIQAAILNGDSETGVSIIKMVRRLDAGPIVAQQRFRLVGNDTGGSLTDELASVSARMMPSVAIDWCSRGIQALPQNDEEASYTRELTKADGGIDWREDAAAIERKARAYWPWPTAWTRFGGRRVAIVECAVEGRKSAQLAGSITVEQRAIFVACGTDSIRLVTVQPEGKRAMTASDWFRGLRGIDDPRFDELDAGQEMTR